MVLKSQCVCDRCCVTEAKMLNAYVIAHGVKELTCMWWKLCHQKPGFYLAYYLNLSSDELIQYVWQLVFAYIFIKGWVINSEENGFFDRSCQTFIISALDAKIVSGIIMTSCVMIIIDWWWGFHILFISFLKCSAWLPSIFFLTVHSYHTGICMSSHFSARWYLYPWVLQKVLDSSSSPKVHLYSMFAADVFTALT